MTAKKPVKVFWYPADERGRKSPPPGPKYFAAFKPKSSRITDETWSVLLELLPQSGHRFSRDGMLSFVSQAAPISSLHPGQAFYLFEGRWPVAEGVVLQDDELDS